MVHKSIGGGIAGVALVPQSVAAAGTSNGATISKPAALGRTLEFHLLGAVNTGVTVLTIRLEGRVGSGAWGAVKDKSNNDITFTAADTIAAAALANGHLLGTVMIDRLPYDDYRLAVTVVTGATATFAACYVIRDLFDRPAGKKDHFLYKETNITESVPLDTSN